MSKPKVIFVTSVYDDVGTGPSTYARYLWEGFRDDKDIEFHLVAPRSTTEHPRLHPVQAVGRSLLWETQNVALNLARSFPDSPIVHGNGAYMMFKFLSYPGPWIVQVNDYESATAWNNPIVSIREFGLRRFLSLAWRQRQERRVVKRASRIVCNSEYVKKVVADRYLIDTNHLVTIYKAVRLEDFSNSLSGRETDSNRSQDELRLLFVGTNWQLKGLPTLFSALKIISNRYRDCRLTIVGPNVLEHAAIARAATNAGVAENIHLAGQVARERLPALFATSDVYVHPARSEALGVAILEALATGTPVVASNVGGIPEIIATPDQGYLVPPLEPEPFAQAILQVVEDAQLRNRLRAAGPPRAAEFSVEKMLAKVKQLYLELNESVGRG